MAPAPNLYLPGFSLLRLWYLYSMRLLFVCLMLALSAPCADKQWAGTYLGDWSSTIGATKGSFRMTLKSAAGDPWQAEVTFTLGDREVKTTVKRLKIADSKIEVAYEYDLGDNRLMSEITGELANGKLEGRYQAKTVPDGSPIDEGVWKCARQ